MKTIIVLITTTLALFGCGGGGSGDSTSPTQPKNTSGQYSTDELDVDFSITNQSSRNMEVIAYARAQASPYPVELDEADKLSIVVDGLRYQLEPDYFEDGTLRSYAANIPSSGSEYIVEWHRDQALVSSLTATELPLPFELTQSFDGDSMDLSWSPQTNHSYYHRGEFLECKNQSLHSTIGGFVPDLSKGEQYVTMGHYQTSLSGRWNESLSSLMSVYDTCKVEITIASDSDTAPFQTNAFMSLSLVAERIATIQLW
ncbi:hypothetical protein [Vibrio barjaei]|uniref:hypothetical protein n=1 Tax=Vibrio barjaei TaxID=1676683 RepID=UPI0007BB1D9A|nr:hypothetical protein [Vibrio barjaei]OIN28863.1 hypothetical protein AWH66_2006425 [Vibrio barjaei]